MFTVWIRSGATKDRFFLKEDCREDIKIARACADLFEKLLFSPTFHSFVGRIQLFSTFFMSGYGIIIKFGVDEQINPLF